MGAWLALWAWAPVARAQSTTPSRVGVLRFRDCGALEEAQVRPLLDADLRGASADGASNAIDVDVSCAGDAALVLSLPGRGGTPRVLEVGDVPPRLRARLAALAISELLLIATSRAESPTAPASPALDATVAAPPAADALPPARAPLPAALDVSAASSLARAPSAPRHLGTPELAPESAAALTLPASASRPQAARSARGALAHVALGSGRTYSPLLAPLVRGSLRVFLAGGAVLWGGDALLRVGPFAAGLHLSTAPATQDSLGTLAPSLVLGLAELGVVGFEAGWLDLLLAARASLGRAFVSGQARGPAAFGRRLGAPFAEGALVVSAAAVTGSFALGLDVALGYSAGLVALSDARTALSLSGATLSLSLSVEVLP